MQSRSVGSPSGGASSFRETSNFRTDQNSHGNSGRREAGHGGGSSKPPCTFFAQGRCRSGDACTFSHDISGSERFGSSSGRGGSFGTNSGRATGGSFGNSGGRGIVGTFGKNSGRGNRSSFENNFSAPSSLLGGGPSSFSGGGFGGGSDNNPFGVPRR
jgi:CCCH-type zinc finger